MNFTFHPAIRPGTGKDWSCPIGTLDCPDEQCGCPYTRWELCAIHAEEITLDKQVRFMTCYDSQNIPYSSDWVQFMNPMSAAQQCAQDLNMNWSAIQSCAGNISGRFANGTWNETIGQMGLDLANKAAAYFYDTFPENRGEVNGRFHVPHLYINNVEQDLNNLADMWNVTKQLCDSGAHNAPVCSSVDKALEPIWTGATKDVGSMRDIMA